MLSSKKDPESKQIVNTNWWMFVFAVVAVVILWAGSGFLIHWLAGPDQGRGTFGDMFGAVNALFSGLAFCGLIFAIYMQHEELKLQREELRLQREEATATRFEIKGQKEQAIAQNATLDLQTFDNTFFQLLRHHEDIVNGIKTNFTGNQKFGRDCFEARFEQMISHFNNISSNASVQRNDVLATALGNLSPQIDQLFGHYLRSTRNILDFIDANAAIDKQRYARFFIDQLSSYEISLIMYRCMSGTKYDALKLLIEKYSALRNLDPNCLLDKDSHNIAFSVNAFGTDHAA